MTMAISQPVHVSAAEGCLLWLQLSAVGTVLNQQLDQDQQIQQGLLGSQQQQDSQIHDALNQDQQKQDQQIQQQLLNKGQSPAAQSSQSSSSQGSSGQAQPVPSTSGRHLLARKRNLMSFLPDISNDINNKVCLTCDFSPLYWLVHDPHCASVFVCLACNRTAMPSPDNSECESRLHIWSCSAVYTAPQDTQLHGLTLLRSVCYDLH